MLLELSQTLHSDAFAQSARHPDFPRAFTRRRQLPLPALVATLLCMRASSQQCLLDSVFGAMRDTATMVRGVSDRAFAKARSHLHMPALSALNDRVLAHAERAGMVPRWQGLRLVAADASVLMPAIRRCKRTQHLAAADQRLFALYLPGRQIRVLMTNLSAQDAPAATFGALYHRRWRIEEAFKRLKWRLKLEAVSGLSQHAVLVDVAAKVLADNLCALMCAAAHASAMASADMRCAPTSALHILQRALPRLLLPITNLPTMLQDTLSMIAHSLKRPQQGRTTPRADVRSKPHQNLAYKG